MRVLITGAAGLLGNHIVRTLIQNHHKPVCLVRSNTDTRTLDHLDCDFVLGSVENYTEVEKAVQECDAVVHAASIYSHSSQEYRHFEQVNVLGTINLVEAVLKYDLKKFIYISTANTIGAGTKSRPGIELNEFDSFHLSSNYLNSKYIAEQYVLEQVEKNGLDAVVINPTFMIGPYDSKPSSGRMIMYGLQNKILLIPPGGKNFVHVKDVAKVSVQSLIHSKKGEKYLVAGFNYSYREFFRLLSDRTGEKKWIIPVPRPLFLLAAAFTELIKGKKAEFNPSNAKVLGRDNYYSGAKACRDFNYRPTDIEEALDEALDWFKRTKLSIPSQFLDQGGPATLKAKYGQVRMINSISSEDRSTDTGDGSTKVMDFKSLSKLNSPI